MDADRYHNLIVKSLNIQIIFFCGWISSIMIGVFLYKLNEFSVLVFGVKIQYLDGFLFSHFCMNIIKTIDCAGKSYGRLWLLFNYRGRLKSPWSRRKRKHALSPRQWRSLFTPDGKLRDGGVKFLKKVRSRVSCQFTHFIILFNNPPENRKFHF